MNILFIATVLCLGLIIYIYTVFKKPLKTYDSIETFFDKKSLRQSRDPNITVLGIPSEIIHLPVLPVSDIVPDTFGQYAFFNPSIQFWKGECWYTVRFSNWTYCNGDFMDTRRRIKYSNDFVYLTNFKYILSYFPKPKHNIQDCRLVGTRNGLYLLGNASTDPASFFDRKMCLYGPCDSDISEAVNNKQEYQVCNFKVEHLKWLETDDKEQGRVEKNWVPLVTEDTGDLFLLRSINPSWLYKVDTKSGVCKLMSKKWNDKIPYSIRGGSQLRHVRNGTYLGIAHFTNLQRKYSSICFLWDHNIQEITAISKPFLFSSSLDNPVIQFVTGLEISRENLVYITYAENDCKSLQCTLKLDQLLPLLETI